ncbi:MAG: KH domain-containing protein [Turicibacter sp.]
MSYISLIENLISPLINHLEDLRVKEFPSEDEAILFQVMVNQDDLGRVIGKQGKTINAIRTIVYAAGSKENKKVRINVDSY